MQTYADMTKEQLQEELTKVRQIYKEYQDKGLKLDMSRGKPSSGQLDLGMGLLNAVDAESLMQAENGLDTRNYGGLDGIPEAKRLLAGFMEVSPGQVIKCFWCVPKYSNPQGVIYSDETVRRMAALKPAAKDFRIFWDNAYAVHHLYGAEKGKILNILDECEKAGNPDMVFEFCSTSKISFAGGGIAAIAASEANLADIKKSLTIQTIGFDKVNQLRHVRFFKDADGIAKHMEKHAEFLRPRFELVLETLESQLSGLGAGSWIKPMGGYFITYETNEGCAKRVVALAKEAGVVLTPAGAPFPYGKDPKDSVIRIAPSYPTMEDLKAAAEIFCVCVKVATIEKLLEN